MAISGSGYEVIPATLACQPVGGLAARNQASSAWQQGVKRHDILTGRKRVPVNVRCGKVGITGGYVAGADPRASSGYLKGRKSRIPSHDGMPGGWQEAMRSL